MSRGTQAFMHIEPQQGQPPEPPDASGGAGHRAMPDVLSSSSRWWPICLLVLVCALVNLNSLGNGWTLDDETHVLGNQNIQGGFSLKSTVLDQLPPGFEKLDKNYRPVADLSYRVNYLLGEGNATVYRVTNILLAALCSVWLFLTLRQLFGDFVPALWAALFFSVLPVHTEVVNSIAWGRSELLGCWFGLLAFHSYLLRVRRHSRPWLWAAAAGAFAFLAFLANERMWALPLIVLLMEFVVAARASRRRFLAVFWKRSMPVHALMWAGLLVSVALRNTVLGEWMPAPLNPLANPLQFEDLSSRFWTGLKLIWHGLVLQVLPLNLSHDYSWHSIPVLSGWGWQAFLLLLVGVAWIAAIVFSVRLVPWLAAGMIFYSVAALGFANLLYLTPRMFAEHYVYWPSAGVAILLGYSVAAAIRMATRRFPILPVGKLVVATSAIVLVSLGLVSVVRNRDWRDAATLSQADLPKYPANVLMRLRAGNLLLMQGRAKEAAAQFLTGYWVHPGAHELLASLSAGYLAQKEYAQALQTAQGALRLAPNNPGYRVILGVILARSGKADMAAAVWQQVIDQFPNYPYSFYFRALMREARRDFWGAEQDYARTVALAPGFRPAKLRLDQLQYLLKPGESKQLMGGINQLQ